MKKFILILMFLVAITGCSNNGLNKSKDSNKDGVIVNIGDESFKLKSKRTFKNIEYLENYIDFHTDAIGNIRTMDYYRKDDFVFEVRVMYDEEHSLEEFKKNIKHEESKKIINGIEYSYYNYENMSKNIVHLYVYNHKNIIYNIMFIFKDDLPEFENVFMNNVKYY